MKLDFKKPLIGSLSNLAIYIFPARILADFFGFKTFYDINAIYILAIFLAGFLGALALEIVSDNWLLSYIGFIVPIIVAIYYVTFTEILTLTSQSLSEGIAFLLVGLVGINIHGFVEWFIWLALYKTLLSRAFGEQELNPGAIN